MTVVLNVVEDVTAVYCNVGGSRSCSQELVVESWLPLNDGQHCSDFLCLVCPACVISFHGSLTDAFHVA